MSDSPWNEQGTTLSHKNACKEFGLTENALLEAIQSGKLQYRLGYAHGNPWFRLLRTEVESFARELKGDNHAEAQRIKHRLQTIDTEVRRLKRQLVALEKEKLMLLRQETGRSPRDDDSIPR
jgi:signal transduction protein with GAF and PtsI domain